MDDNAAIAKVYIGFCMSIKLRSGNQIIIAFKDIVNGLTIEYCIALI